MKYHESIIELIGDTPLIRLRRITEGLAAPVLAKVEYLNPGGSVKDRIALRMVEAAETAGILRPGGVIVEPTSGNTGVGLAIVAQDKGYRCIFTCPDKVSPDKIAVLRAYGAEVVMCPAAVLPDHPDSYRSVSSRLASEIPGAVKLDQYSNDENARSHYLGTGPELWEQTSGAITHFVTAVGTGGTITGAGRYLKEVSGGLVRIIGADPDGSVYSGGSGRPYLLEGVGQPSVPQSYDPDVPDEVIAVSDADALRMTRRLAREEALLTGGSCGMAVVAALQVAAKLEADAVVVVLLADSGRGYLSKIFDDGWMARHGLVDTAGNARSVRTLPGGSRPTLPVIAPWATVTDALSAMHASGASHLLLTSAEPPLRLGEVQGIVAEPVLTRLLAQGRARPSDSVRDHADRDPALVGAGEPVTRLQELLDRGHAAIVMEDGLPVRIVTSGDVASVAAGSALPTPTNPASENE
jgi:cystathionine beta-synthase